MARRSGGPRQGHSISQKANVVLRLWRPIVASVMRDHRDGGEGAAFESDVVEALRVLDTTTAALRHQLGESGGGGSASKIKHSATKLESLRLARTLKGGPWKLQSAIERALWILFPSQDIRDFFVSSKSIKIPSASTLQRYELSLDVGLMLWRSAEVQTLGHPCCITSRVHSCSGSGPGPTAGFSDGSFDSVDELCRP